MGGGWSGARRARRGTAVSTMADVSAAGGSPASTRPRSQPRRASRAIPAATAARPTRTVKAIRPRTPTVSAQSLGSRYTPASLEPIADLGKKEMSDPGYGREPPEPGSLRPSAVAAHRSPARFLKHRVIRPTRLGLAKALHDQEPSEIFVIHVACPPSGQSTTFPSPAGAAECGSPPSGFEAR